MTRDELIEELQKCPYNNEVRIRLALHPDYFEGVKPGECAVEDLPIFGITTIPAIVIDCVEGQP